MSAPFAISRFPEPRPAPAIHSRPAHSDVSAKSPAGALAPRDRFVSFGILRPAKGMRPESILAQQVPPRMPTPPILTYVESASGQSLPESARQSPDAPTRLLAALAHLERNLQPSHYDHSRRVDLEAGIVRCDCSQLVGALLATTSPVAAREASGLAARIFAGLRRVDPAQPSAGWQRILRIADLRPGDVIAWPTPAGLPSRVTGHVVIAVGPPQPYRNGFLVRIADSTSLPHGEDTRAGGSGFGYGIMYFEVDPATGEGIGYGWTGRYSVNYVLRTPIAVGRPRS